MGGEKKGPGELAGAFPCLIHCEAAGEVTGHPAASRNRSNFVLTLAAGSALKEGNVYRAVTGRLCGLHGLNSKA